MTLLFERDPKTEPVGHPWVEQPPRRPSLRPGVLAVTAGSSAGAATWAVAGWDRAVLSGTATTALLMVLLVRQARRSLDWSTPALNTMIVLTAALVAGGAALDRVVAIDGVATTVIVGWVVVAAIVSAARVTGTETDGRVRERLTLVTGALVLALCAAGLIAPRLAPAVGLMGAVISVSLAVVLCATAAGRRRPSDVTVLVYGAAIGGVAAFIAAHEGVLRDAGRPTLVLAAATTGCALLAIAAGPSAHRPISVVASRLGGLSSRSMLPLGAAVALCATGAGPSVMLLVGLGAMVFLDARRSASATATPAAAAVAMPEQHASTVRARIVVGALTAVGAALRLGATRGLWLDEATSVHQARLPFVEMIRLMYRTDVQPPLHDIILWADIRLVGDSELAVRLPSVLFGTLLIPMLYVTAKELFDRRAGMIAAAIATVAPLAVWYGQEARMYAQFMLLAAITVWAQARILRTGRTRYWVILVLASVALVASQYFAALHVAALFVAFVAVTIRRRRRRREAAALARRTCLAALSIIVLLAPLVPFALHQAAQNQKAGFGFSSTVALGSTVTAPPGIYGFLTNLQWMLWGYQADSVTERLVALWPVGLLVLLLVLGRQRRSANRHLLLIAGLPMGAIFAASIFAAKSRSLAEVRYFAGAVPVVFILIAGALATSVRSRGLRNTMVGVLLASMAFALVTEQTSSANPRYYEYREAMAWVAENAEPGDRLYFTPEYANYVLEYYNPGVPSIPLSDGPPGASGGRVFLVLAPSFANTGQGGDAEAQGALETLAEQGLTVTARRDDAQITVWELS